MLLAKELSLEVLIGEPHHSMLSTLWVGPDIVPVVVEKGAGSDDVRKAEQSLGRLKQGRARTGGGPGSAGTG